MRKGLILFFVFVCFYASAKGAEDNQLNRNVRLQIFLLHEDFSPGKIDGRNGKFTNLVLNLYKKSHPSESTQSIHKAAEQLSPLYINYKISESDEKYIGEVPDKPEEQANKDYMPYRSFVEMIADRFHTDVAFLKHLNPGVSMETLKPGDELKVPNVKPFLIEKMSNMKAKKSSKYSDRSIKIYTKNNILTLNEGDNILASFPITSGRGDLASPKGVWNIEKIIYLPWFRYDKKMLNEGKKSNDFYNIPPGPNSPVGVVWIALNKPGIGIHGTNTPKTIGRSVSHGCIRLSNWDVVKLSTMITPNSKVEIDQSSLPVKK